MLARRHRISGKDFPAIFRRGRRARGPLCSVVFVRGSDGLPQCACVVPKRVLRSAVLRNRLRRRCYAALDPLIDRLLGGSRCVVYPAVGALKAPLMEIQRELRLSLTQVLKQGP